MCMSWRDLYFEIFFCLVWVVSLWMHKAWFCFFRDVWETCCGYLHCKIHPHHRSLTDWRLYWHKMANIFVWGGYRGSWLEPEPWAASLFLGALKNSHQKIQKSASCPNMVFITCGLDHQKKMCDETGLTKSNRIVTWFYPFFWILNISEEKYSNDEPVCQKCSSQQILVNQNNWTTSRQYPNYAEISGIFALA